MPPEVEHPKPQESVQDTLHQILGLLDKQQIVEELVHKQGGPRQELVESLLHKQHMVELQSKLGALHPADVAYILEALPLDRRLRVWDLVKADREGEILLELSEPVRETLIAHMEPEELVAAAEQLDTDEIADLAPDLPDDVMDDVFKALPVAEREQLRAAMSYREEAVGALMDFDLVTVREDLSLEVVLRYLRRLDELPDHTDQLFVVDRRETLRGALPINRLLVNDPEMLVRDVMKTDMLMLHDDDEAQEAAQAFERYDLVTAPVTDRRGRLVGRVTVDAVLDFIRERAEAERLNLGGLREEEDIFASVWASARNRWAWLAVNLVTAFVASRVISVFEGTIAKLVALARARGLRLGCSPATFLGEAQQTAAALIRAGRLGTVRAVYAEVNWGRIETWHPAPAPFYDVGALVDVGVYPLTLVTTMLGPARSVRAWGWRLRPERTTLDGTSFRIGSPDLTVVALELEIGAVVRLTASFYVGAPARLRGTLEFHGDEASLALGSFQDFDATVELGPFGGKYETVAPVRPAFRGTAWARGVAEMASAIDEDRPHRASAEQAAHIVDIIEAAAASMADDGSPIQVSSSFPEPALMPWASLPT